MGLDGAPRLVGRRVELALVDEMLERAVNGTAVLLLRGEPGVGTTRLLDEACARAVAAGCRVARTGTSPLEADLGYAVLNRLLRPLLLAGPSGAGAAVFEGLPALATVLPSLGQASVAGEPGTDRLRVGESVRLALARRGRQRPVLLAVDDVEDADAASLATLLHVLRSPGDLRLGLVLTAHASLAGASRGGVVGGFARALQQLPGSIVHDVEPLRSEAVREMVTDLLADEPPPDVVAHILEQVQGSPLLVRGVVGTLLSTGGLTRDAGRWLLRPDLRDDVATVDEPVGLGDLARRRIERLDPHRRLATSLLALAGGRLEHVVMVRALRELDPGADPDEVVADVAATSLVTDESTPRLTYLLTHPVLVTVAAADLSPLERGRAHAALARALAETSPDDLDRPAVQAALAGDALDDIWAADLLVRALRSALDRGAGEAALRHARAGLQRVGSVADNPYSRALLRGHALALELSGSTADALAAWGEVAARSEREGLVGDHLEAVHHLARLDSENGRPERALERIDVLRTRPAWARGGAQARVTVLDLATGVAQRLGRDADHLLAELVTAAEESGSRAARRRALLRSGEDLYDRGDLRGVAELVARLDRDEPELARSVAIFELEWQDPHQALRLLDAARAAVAADPFPLDALRLDEARLLALVRCDRFDEALDTADTVERLAARFGSGRSASYASLARGLVHVHRGRSGLARGDLQAALTAYPPLRGADRHLTAYADLLHSWVDLASGRPRAVVEAWRRDVRRRRGGLGFVAEANLVLGRALRATGEVDALRELARALADGVPDSPTAHAISERVAGWSAAEDGRPDEAFALLTRSAERLTGLSLQREAASARLDAAELGDPAGTAPSVQEALTVLEALGCAPEVRRARRILRRTGDQQLRRRTGDLTERELDVARLVAEGLTDAEIARRLFVSPRTVTTHLQHAYRRLGLSGRTALARYVLERADT